MLDDATVEMMRNLAAQSSEMRENGTVIDVDDPVINLLLEALANRAQYLNEVGLEYLISRLKQLYVERLPDKGLSTNDFTDEYLNKLLNAASKGDLQNVKNELTNMIDAITSFDYMVVSELPSKGKKGVIYLKRLTSFVTVKNLYEEYIWVQDRYELLGSVEVGGPADGPFVTTDDFKDTLKNYIQKIIVNGTTFTPSNGTVTLDNYAHRIKINGSFKTVSANGDVDLGTFSTSGDVPNISVKLNNDTYTPNASGLINLGKVTYNVILNGNYYTPESYGTLSLPALVTTVKVNGSTYSVNATGTVDLGEIGGTGGDTPNIKVKVNSTNYSPNSSGIISLGYLCDEIKLNGVEYSASSSGSIDLPNLVGGVTVNGATRSITSSGNVSLGTITRKIKIGGLISTPHNSTSSETEGENDITTFLDYRYTKKAGITRLFDDEATEALADFEQQPLRRTVESYTVGDGIEDPGMSFILNGKPLKYWFMKWMSEAFHHLPEDPIPESGS